ncbi:hypothetical protein QTP88_005744 [Uroleucon formosanum]
MTKDLQDTTIFYGECNDRRQFGTGFAVHKSIVPLVTEFKSTNPRISILTIKGKFFDITFLNGHAPTEEKTPEEKDDFYENLEQTLNEIPRNRIRIVLGDFNAKLGKENIFRTTIGLVVKSTMFPRKDIYKGTWKAPNSRYTNQIDHVMINTRFKNCIQEVKTVRGADCDSDHYLVKGKLNVKLKKLGVRKGTMVDRYEVNKFKDKTVCDLFKQRMNEAMSNLHINQLDTIDGKWEAIKETLKVVTDTTIGKQKKVKKPWFNTSCEEALNRRKEARLQWINDPTNREKESTYKERQKEASNIFRFEKRKLMQLMGGYKKHERFLKNEDGSIITEQDKIIEKWKEYFDQLLNCEDPLETFTWISSDPNDSECPPPSRIEVVNQLNRLKNNKTPGEDGIQGEILKNLDKVAINRIHDIIENLWSEEQLPKD